MLKLLPRKGIFCSFTLPAKMIDTPAWPDALDIIIIFHTTKRILIFDFIFTRSKEIYLECCVFIPLVFILYLAGLYILYLRKVRHFKKILCIATMQYREYYSCCYVVAFSFCFQLNLQTSGENFEALSCLCSVRL